MTKVVDGAHNPEAAVSLRAYLDSCLAAANSTRVHWIIGAMQKKDVEGIVNALVRKVGAMTHALCASLLQGSKYVTCVHACFHTCVVYSCFEM